MSNINIMRDKIHAALLSNIEPVLDEWLPDGSIIGDQFSAKNPTRDDTNPGSFTINLTEGYFKDFADPDFAGHDLVALYMLLNDVEEDQALAKLKAFISKRGYKKTVRVKKQDKPQVVTAPPPEDAPQPPDIHPDLFEPSMKWEYKTAQGETAFYVYRFETEKGKETRPVSYNPETEQWQWKLPEAPYPIYNLNQIKDDSRIIISEGEKTADAASRLFNDYVSTTTVSGSSNALKSDLSPLYGKKVVILSDADEPGKKYLSSIAAELLLNDCHVLMVDVWALGWINGEDIADHSDINQQWLDDNAIDVKEWSGFKDLDQYITEAAARLPLLDYDRKKEFITDLLGGVGKRTLDKLVKDSRKPDYEGSEETDSIFAEENLWPEEVNGLELVTEIKNIIQQHVILSEPEALAVALWIINTYVFNEFRICPKLLINSPEKRCGKTTLIETVQALSYRALAVSNISPAAIYRSIEAWQPALLIDEGDTFLHGNEELRGIINSGHTKSSAFVIRISGDELQPQRFSTFAPMAIGMIKQPPDTIADRSIAIKLHRKLMTDSIQPLPIEAEQEYLHIREKCLRWTEDNRDALTADRDLTPHDLDNDRARDNWTPLTAIALLCDVIEEAQVSCRELTTAVDDDNLTHQLLEDIHDIFRDSKKDKLPSKVVVKKLISLEERPWPEFIRGKPINQNRLARLLKPFDIHTQQARSGPTNAKHYFLGDFIPIFARYLNVSSTPPKITETPKQTPSTLDNAGASEVSSHVSVSKHNRHKEILKSDVSVIKGNQNTTETAQRQAEKGRQKDCFVVSDEKKEMREFNLEDLPEIKKQVGRIDRISPHLKSEGYTHINKNGALFPLSQNKIRTLWKELQQ